LQEGNARYVKGVSKHARIDAEKRMETATTGQKPYATILGCSDSRVPVELVFDQGFAELFVVRVAGNVCAEAELASIEYGVKYLGTSVVVVLGHSKCGAVDGAVSGAQLKGSLPKLMALIEPAVGKTRRDHPELKGEALLNAAIEENVYHSIEQIISGSPGLRDKMKSKELRIVGAIRDLKTGAVRWLGEHPNQTKLIAQAQSL